MGPSWMFVALSLLGHGALWVALFNRLHGTGWHYRFLRRCDLAGCLLVLGIPAGALYISEQLFIYPRQTSGNPWVTRLYVFYGVVCCMALLWFVMQWGLHRFRSHLRRPVLSNHTLVVHLRDRPTWPQMIGKRSTRCCLAIPRNQILDLYVHTKTIYVGRLDRRLEGLSIAHLSDLHLTGQLTPAFFHAVIDETLRLQADIIVVTGDIIDKAACLPWLAEIFGRLQSRYGIYFVLGNHDKRLPEPKAIRGALTGVGMVDLGGQWRRIMIHGQPVLLVGNEQPWFGPGPNMEEATADAGDTRPLRIGLAHTPDQIAWARRHDLDLLLAGHTHGGQFRLPVIGPVLSPSRYGARFASGTFYLPPTVLHVSRGISGTRPLRFRCPPELTKLVLTASRSAAAPEEIVSNP